MGPPASGLGRRLVIAAILLASAACQRTAATASASSFVGVDTTTDSTGHFWVTTRSERNLLGMTVDGTGPHPFVVRERSTSTCCDGSEHNINSIFVVERLATGGDSALWSATAPFDHGGIEDLFYRGVEDGCCDAPDRSSFISLFTGATAFTATAPDQDPLSLFVTVEAPNTPLRRYISFDDRVDLLAPDDRSPHRLFGVLQYGDGARAPARYAIRAPGDTGLAMRFGSLRVRESGKSGKGETRLDLWKGDGKNSPASLGGFDIRLGLTFVESGRDLLFVIPVVQDSLDLTHAALPRGWVLEPYR